MEAAGTFRGTSLYCEQGGGDSGEFERVRISRVGREVRRRRVVVASVTAPETNKSKQTNKQPADTGRDPG